MSISPLCVSDYTVSPEARVGSCRADERGFSVTVVSIVRLAYIIIFGWVSEDSLGQYEDIFIWTNVETNMSIICGQWVQSHSSNGYV